MPVKDPDAIDVEQAQFLRGRGMSWRQVGRMLADLRGRHLPYHGASVLAACARRKLIHNPPTS